MNQTKKRFRFFRWLEELKAECKRIHWSSKVELKKNLQLVLLATIISGFAIYLVDFIIKALLQLFNALGRYLLG